ncbi:protein transport protein Sec16B isoform X2 [Dendrobates tinctorius]|uniref:protein transport protein Sec16B isoform X2 n=1 Tax=Dendrobates tinctorius TaxID=92724 RepID=UPI003CC93C9D
MDHGPPHWFNQPPSRPPEDMGQWRGMYPPPPPPPHHYRDGCYGYYPPYSLQGSHQAWPAPWMDYYSQYPANIPRHIDYRRPASRAEIYDRSEAYRPLSRQGYDERYGFYETVHRENYGNREYNYEPPVGVSQEKDGRRIYNNQIERWVQNSSKTYACDQNLGIVHPQRDVLRLRRYEDDRVQHPAERRCDSALDRLEYFSSAEPSLLSQYRDSGMSSSSYELSQYMQDPADSWNPLQDDTLEQTPQPTAPMKFSLPHVTVCFGARGHLIRVCPNFPDEGQPALVEIHSTEILLCDTLEQEEMREFPGPMQREDLHKVDVMNYCQQNVSQCLCSQGAKSRDNALLWQVLLQMCRQNGCITGTDLADLLLQDCKLERYRKEQEHSELISLGDEPPLIPNGAQMDLLTGEIPSNAETTAQAVEKFTKLLYFGRKKATVDWAMKSQLWGHALFLASKMDSRTYSWVMARFTSTLAVNDPLQTLFQLMAGRIPQAASFGGDKKWGDWRPHLAVMLSNPMSDPEVNQRAIIAMGDNLVLKGLTEAGHCCYLTAGISLGKISEKSDRLVLLGSNQNQSFKKFASTANIQRTEILEYCQILGKISHFMPSFQTYKFVYAARLVDYGLTSVALHYCECIAAAILLSNSGSLVLISELIKLSERLKYSDPQLLERPEPEWNQDPTWLVRLHALVLQLQKNCTSGTNNPVISEGQGSNTAPNTTEVSTSNEAQQLSQDHNTGANLPDTGAYVVNTGANVHKTGADLKDTGADLQNTRAEQPNSGADLHNTEVHLHNAGAHQHNTGVHLHNTGAHLHNTGAHLHNTGAHLHNTGAHLHHTGAHLHHTGAHLHHTGAHLHHAGADLHNTGADLHNAGANLHNAGADLHTTGAELGRAGSQPPQYTHLQHVEPQHENTYEWGVQQPAPVSELSSDYNTYDGSQEKESLDEISDSPSPSSSFSNNALMMKNMLRRVSTVSEASTVSMDDDDGEDRSSDEAQAHKAEDKKGSSFGWFSWFRSKPAKDTAVPPKEAQVPPKPSSLTQPPVALNKFQPPPPSISSYQLPKATSDSLYTGTGIKETEDLQKMRRSSVSSENQGQQESTVTYPNVPGNQMNQPTGAIPLYNPLKFSQDVGPATNRTARPPRGRYPLQRR